MDILKIAINVLEQASLFGLVAMGVFITYKILDFPDLSVDGTYPLGACISAVLLVNGVNPWIAVVASALGGAIAGFITAFLHVKLMSLIHSLDLLSLFQMLYKLHLKF